MVRDRLDYLEIAGDEPVLKGEFNDHVNDESLHGTNSDTIIDAIEDYNSTIDATVTRAEYAERGGDGGGGTGGGGEMIPDTIHIDDHGADPSGDSPSDAALDAAVDAASSGDVIAITNGTYYFSDRHTFYKSVILDGSGSRIESDCHYDGSSFQANHYWPLFKFQGYRGSDVGVSSSSSKGSDQVDVESSASFDVGEGVIVSNMDTGSALPARSYTSTVSRIRKIDGNTLYLTKALKYDINSSWVASPAEFLYRPTVRNMDIYPRNELYYDSSADRVLGGPQQPISTQWTWGTRIENCYIDTYDSNAYASTDCANAVITDVHTGHPMNLSGSSGEAYLINGSSDIAIIRPTIEGCRRAIDIRSGCKTLYTIDPRISGASLGAISFHSGNGEGVVGRHEIRGGYIHTRMEESLRAGEVMSGTIVRGTNPDTELVVSDCELIANAWDQNTEGYIKLNNCRMFKPADGYTGNAPFDLGIGEFEFYNTEFECHGSDAIHTRSDGTGKIKLNNVTSNASFLLNNGSHDVWLGMVDAPSVSASTSRDPYNVS